MDNDIFCALCAEIIEENLWEKSIHLHQRLIDCNILISCFLNTHFHYVEKLVELYKTLVLQYLSVPSYVIVLCM